MKNYTVYNEDGKLVYYHDSADKCKRFAKNYSKNHNCRTFVYEEHYTASGLSIEDERELEAEYPL